MATLAKYNSSHFFVILKTKKMILSTNEIKAKMQNARKRSNPLPANISSIIKREIGLPEPERIVNRTNNKTIIQNFDTTHMSNILPIIYLFKN